MNTRMPRAAGLGGHDPNLAGSGAGGAVLTGRDVVESVHQQHDFRPDDAERRK